MIGRIEIKEKSEDFNGAVTVLDVRNNGIVYVKSNVFMNHLVIDTGDISTLNKIIEDSGCRQITIGGDNIVYEEVYMKNKRYFFDRTVYNHFCVGGVYVGYME